MQLRRLNHFYYWRRTRLICSSLVVAIFISICANSLCCFALFSIYIAFINNFLSSCLVLLFIGMVNHFLTPLFIEKPCYLDFRIFFKPQFIIPPLLPHRTHTVYKIFENFPIQPPSFRLLATRE